ncbi:MAG: hypothetical protein JNK47_10845 [Mesorhizobium sp.]|nr:hypothetical protein [Mesorhizobium sp.]MBL8577715.1 hypothetical protein [Mesorhizobium sp.]
MIQKHETAGSGKRGGLGISNAVTPFEYPRATSSATEIASEIIAQRFRISPCMARVVCELAQIGGRV